MYETVIVPLDGARSAESALPAALRLAGRAGAALRLLSVVDVPDPLVAWSRRGPSSDGLDAQRNERQAYLDSLAARLDYDRHDTHIAVGDPSRSILAGVEQAEPAILVMARRPRSAPREHISRGVTLWLARHVRSPLVVVPAVDDPDPTVDFRLDSVLVPLDGSRLAEKVLPALTGEVLDPSGLQIHLLSVVETAAWHSSGRAVMYAYDLERYIADMRRVASGYLTRMHHSLAAAAAEVRCDIRVGRVSEQICLAADKADVDLIVMSTHGRSGMERFLLGSVAEAVVTEAHRPVLLIRAAE